MQRPEKNESRKFVVTAGRKLHRQQEGLWIALKVLKAVYYVGVSLGW
jgi:hypothetical protein